MKTIKIHVQGRVQGVGFRYFAHRKAGDLNVTGWVRNRDDGSVEMVAQGDPSHLHQFLTVLEKGPAFASVIRIDVDEIEQPEPLKDFRVIS